MQAPEYYLPFITCAQEFLATKAESTPVGETQMVSWNFAPIEKFIGRKLSILETRTIASLLAEQMHDDCVMWELAHSIHHLKEDVPEGTTAH